MIERDYIKLNTSIQTGSNAKQLHYDDEGNIEATIELRLPDSLFVSSRNKKIEGVELQTSKFRISMNQTPIAQIPLDLEQTKDDQVVSTCQLDVYPFVLLDDNKFIPEPDDETALSAFPNYKNHFVNYIIRLCTVYDPVTPENNVYINLVKIKAQINTPEAGFPTSSVFYKILKDNGILEYEKKHLLNMCVQSNHESFNISGGDLLIQNIGTLTQMWQDAMENAITFASIYDEQTIQVDFIVKGIYDPLTISPKTNEEQIIEITDTLKIVYWKYQVLDPIQSSSLKYSVKPHFDFSEQSLQIGYDTSPFDVVTPVLWNPPYVNTYDHPEQLAKDKLRKEIMYKPPPKRIYQYDIQTEAISDTQKSSYEIVLKNLQNSAPMNLIVDEKTKNTFNFLPWIEVDFLKNFQTL